MSVKMVSLMVAKNTTETCVILFVIIRVYKIILVLLDQLKKTVLFVVQMHTEIGLEFVLV